MGRRECQRSLLCRSLDVSSTFYLKVKINWSIFQIQQNTQQRRSSLGSWSYDQPAIRWNRRLFLQHMTMELKSKNLRESKIKWLSRHRGTPQPRVTRVFGQAESEICPWGRWSDAWHLWVVFTPPTSPPQGVTLVWHSTQRLPRGLSPTLGYHEFFTPHCLTIGRC